MTYNVRSDATRWQISNFLSNSTSNVCSISHHLSAVVPFDGKYPTFYLIALVTFALSLTIYEIFSNQEECQNFDLEDEGLGHGVEKWDLCHLTKIVRIHVGDFFQNFSYMVTCVYANG